MRISDWSSDVCSSDLLVHRTRSRNLDTRYLPRQEVRSLVLLIYLPTPTYPRFARTVHSLHQDRSRALRCAVRSRTSPAPLCKALAPGTASYCQRYVEASFEW